MRMRRSVLMTGLAWALPASLTRAQPRIAPGLADYASDALTALIDTARRDAIARGVTPMPPAIYRSLLGFFPADLLLKARFATGGAGPLDLPSLAFSYGDAVAMTLSEVILFKSDRAAQTDARLWAHEMTHVMQYQRWGVDGFASRYVRDSAAVEREAVENANRFAAWQHRS
jgi:hypothetical protein